MAHHNRALPPAIPREVPRFATSWSQDMLSGFLVFVIALPMSLGIAMASGFPPIAGIFTAVIGGLLTPWISNSELTIKGPAAGLIAIGIGAISEFRELAPHFGYLGAADLGAYKLTLGVCVIAALLQIAFGLVRAGILVEFFPISAVHGMLAAIGVIIFSKQAHVMLGVIPQAKEPLELLVELPHSLTHMNPEVALIGVVSLLILFGLPLLKHPLLRRIPSPMAVLLFAVPLGLWFDLEHVHTYSLLGHNYVVGPNYLVDLPDSLFAAMQTPDLRGVATWTGFKYVIMFALVATLESLLSAQAIDLLDPWRRKTSFNRELLAVGIANTATAAVGGLPMISEIVRSSANINNGARTRLSNFFHGAFLLLFVVLLPFVIREIPLSALAAMLVYTGCRLASPKEFVSTYRVGGEQLVIFVTTVVLTLSTDLLIGIGGGIAMKMLIHYSNGVKPQQFFVLNAEAESPDDQTVFLTVKDAVIFSNWIPFKRLIEHWGSAGKNVIVDLTGTQLVDHTVVEKLHLMSEDFVERGQLLEVVGLEGHRSLSGHPLAARKRGLVPVRRITLYVNDVSERRLLTKLVELGATGFTSTAITGAGRKQLEADADCFDGQEGLRVEVLVTPLVANKILQYIDGELLPDPTCHVTACIENVLVLRANAL